MPNHEPVRWGVLSTAKINDKFLAGAEAAEGAEVLAVASRDAGRARAYAAQQGIARSYGSYEELLGDGEVEAVYISLPNALHVPWTLRALQAGKHVLCEKPIARRREDASSVVAEATARRRLVSEAFMYRHHPQIARLAQLIDDGAIGPLRAIRSHFCFDLTEPGNVRLSAQLDGGALMDIGCYCLNATRMLAGEPESVTAVATMRDGIDLRMAAALALPDGVVAHFDCGFDFAFGYGLQVVGQHGTVTLQDPWHGRSPGLVLATESGVQEIAIAVVDPYRLEVENFCAAVRGEAPLLIGPDEIVAQAAAMQALYAAAEGGRAVAPMR